MALISTLMLTTSSFPLPPLSSTQQSRRNMAPRSHFHSCHCGVRTTLSLLPVLSSTYLVGNSYGYRLDLDYIEMSARNLHELYTIFARNREHPYTISTRNLHEIYTISQEIYTNYTLYPQEIYTKYT